MFLEVGGGRVEGFRAQALWGLRGFRVSGNNVESALAFPYTATTLVLDQLVLAKK